MNSQAYPGKDSTPAAKFKKGAEIVEQFQYNDRIDYYKSLVPIEKWRSIAFIY